MMIICVLLFAHVGLAVCLAVCFVFALVVSVLQGPAFVALHVCVCVLGAVLCYA